MNIICRPVSSGERKREGGKEAHGVVLPLLHGCAPSVQKREMFKICQKKFVRFLVHDKGVVQFLIQDKEVVQFLVQGKGIVRRDKFSK